MKKKQPTDSELLKRCQRNHKILMQRFQATRVECRDLLDQRDEARNEMNHLRTLVAELRDKADHNLSLAKYHEVKDELVKLKGELKWKAEVEQSLRKANDDKITLLDQERAQHAMTQQRESELRQDLASANQELAAFECLPFCMLMVGDGIQFMFNNMTELNNFIRMQSPLFRDTFLKVKVLMQDNGVIDKIVAVTESRTVIALKNTEKE